MRPVSEQPSGSFTQEIEKDVLFGREGTKHSTRTERPVDGPKFIRSCVPVSVELVDQYEDKDENADADQTRTEKPVGGQQFTQFEEIDIDFGVPGLSHAVVKEAENFRVQELVKKIESHPHRGAFQAGLQQKKRLQPIQQKIEGDDTRIGQCRVIRVVRNNTESAMFSMSSLLESKSDLLHLRTLLG